MAGISDDINNMKVSRDDFMHALDEVHPAFGVSEEELQQVVQNGIIHFNNDIEVSGPSTIVQGGTHSFPRVEHLERRQPLRRTSSEQYKDAVGQRAASRCVLGYIFHVLID
jgi:hypothetical protein